MLGRGEGIVGVGSGVGVQWLGGVVVVVVVCVGGGGGLSVLPFDLV